MTRTAQVEIEMIATYDPSLDPREYLFQDPDYREQDQARLDAWLNDEWRFLGIRAKATIKIPTASIPIAGSSPNCCRLVSGASRATAAIRIFRKSTGKNAKS